MNVSGIATASASSYPPPSTNSPSTSGTSSTVAATEVKDVVSISNSIPAGSAANDTHETVLGINAGIAFENDDASWALVAKYDGAAAATAGRAEFAQRVESAEQGVIGEGLGVSASDFDAISVDTTNAATSSTHAGPASGAGNNLTADQDSDTSAHSVQSPSSAVASTSVTSDPAGSATKAAPTVSDSEIAAADALRTLESITKSKAESPDSLQSAAKLLDSYA